MQTNMLTNICKLFVKSFSYANLHSCSAKIALDFEDGHDNMGASSRELIEAHP
jgi:hypothetical protein